MTCENSAGTLPVSCYSTKACEPKPVDFAKLPLREEEISSDQSSSPEVLICEGTTACVRKGSQPPILQTLPIVMIRIFEDNEAFVVRP